MQHFPSEPMQIQAIFGAAPAPAEAQYRQKITNDAAKCAAGAGPAVRVTITDIKESKGTIRVQSYRGTKEDWLEKGKWIYRMEAPAKAGSMSFCMPLPRPGTYAIAVRHDINGNGSTNARPTRYQTPPSVLDVCCKLTH